MDQDQIPPTFLQNMSALYQLKEEVLRLHYTYSPAVPNYSQLGTLAQLRGELDKAQKRLDQHKKEYMKELKALQGTVGILKSQKKELFEINTELVKANESLARNLEEQGKQLQEANRKAETIKKESEEMANAFRKEIENLKLMHAQELFILKKKK